MNKMNPSSLMRHSALACLLIPLVPYSWQDSDLSTVAEASDWRATATHEEVLELCERMAVASGRVHLEEAGETREGRALPLLVVADPPVRSPGEVGERLVVFAWAGIHAGEVCGKPATLMLARELLEAEAPPLLEQLVIVLLPLLNADGNDRMSPDNRPGQQGPVEGMGTRPNSLGLNINRDFTKLETEEARAVVGVLNRWQPAVVMDLHTTNGSRHRYTLTYDGQRHPASDPDLLRLTREELLPTVSASIEAQTGYRTFFYGNFDREHTRWLTYPGQPRYSTHYLGLRHHAGLLSEAYSYASYPDRVHATLAFVRHTFEYAANNANALRAAIAKARQRTPDEICLRQKTRLSDESITVLGTDEDYRVRHDLASESTLSVRRPRAYFVPGTLTSVVENLRLHGVRLERVEDPLELDVEVYRVESIERAGRAYEKHRMLTLLVEPRRETRAIAAGSWRVDTAQPLGVLAAYLLEPEAEDGLCAWNFMDESLAEGADYPILRLP